MIDQTIQLLYNVVFFITPLIMTKSTSELFEFNKMLLIYASTVLISFFWVLKMIIHKKIILKKTFLDIPIILFFLSQLISAIFSIDLQTSIFGYYGRFNGGLVSILSYIILYFAFISNNINVNRSLKVILASSLLVIFWAVPGKLGHDLTCLAFTGSFNSSCWDNSALAFRPELRAFSTLGQPNWLGAYLAVTFFIGVYFLMKNIKIKKYLILNTCYLVLNFSMILFTRSRSALFAVFAGLTLFIIFYLLAIKINLKKILTILLIIIVIPIVLFKTGEDKIDKFLTFETYKNVLTKKQTVLQTTNYKPLTTNLSSVTESFDIRKIVWQGAWDLGKKYPLFGTGVETFAYSYNLVRPIAHNLTSEWDYIYNKAHNEYLNYLATTGFIGLASYILLIFGFLFYSFKILNIKYQISNKSQILKSKKQNYVTIEQSNNETILVICLLISWLTILITNFFGFSTTTVQLFFYLIPAFIILSINQQATSYQSLVTSKLNNIQKFIIFLLLSSTIYLLFSISVYYLADINYSYGLKYSKINDQQKAAQYFEKALKLRDEPVYKDKFSASLAYLSVIASIQKQKELTKQITALADSYNRKTVQTYPKNVFYWKTRAKNMYYFYQVTGSIDELLQGIAALKTARKLYPTDPKIPYTLSLYYSTLYDSNKNMKDKENFKKLSIEEINKTIELKSNYREAYLFKGQLLKKYGLTEEARKVLEYILKNFDKNDVEVLKELKDL